MAEKRPDRMLGPGHDTFWQWCDKGELRLQRCDRCGHLSWPVCEACERCEGEAFSWAHMSGRAKLVSWCRFERDYYAGVLPLPWDTILVELEEGPLFLSNPKGFTTLDAVAGMPVTLAFIDCEDSAGAFKLPVFVKA
jgi:uncharacterized OB-fold protein